MDPRTASGRRSCGYEHLLIETDAELAIELRSKMSAWPAFLVVSVMNAAACVVSEV